MDGWVDGWVDGWEDAWTDGWMRSISKPTSNQKLCGELHSAAPMQAKVHAHLSVLLVFSAEYMPSATLSMDQGLTRMAPEREGEQPTNSGGGGVG